MNSDYLDRLLQSKKYREICPDTIRRIWSEYEGRYKRARDVDKAVREALHGIAGAFLTSAEARECARDMQDWADGSRSDARLARILGNHTSTRERLPIEAMDALYGSIFEITGKPARVLDIACGINPIYLGARGIDVFGVDISAAAVALVNHFAEVSRAPVSAVCKDLLCEGSIPPSRFDVALMFKVLPLLERQGGGTAIKAMESVNAAYIVASFPTRTLGGRNVGMEAHYAEWMARHLPDKRTVAGRFTAENELIFILKES